MIICQIINIAHDGGGSYINCRSITNIYRVSLLYVDDSVLIVYKSTSFKIIIRTERSKLPHDRNARTRQKRAAVFWHELLFSLIHLPHGRTKTNAGQTAFCEHISFMNIVIFFQIHLLILPHFLPAGQNLRQYSVSFHFNLTFTASTLSSADQIKRITCSGACLSQRSPLHKNLCILIHKSYMISHILPPSFQILTSCHLFSVIIQWPSYL